MYNYLLIFIFALLALYILLNFKVKELFEKTKDTTEKEQVMPTHPATEEEPVKLLTDSVGTIEQVKEVKAKVKAKSKSKATKKAVKKKTPRRRDL